MPLEGCAKAKLVWGNHLCGQELLPEGKIRNLSSAFPQDLGRLISWEAVLFGVFFCKPEVIAAELDRSKILFRTPR